MKNRDGAAQESESIDLVPLDGDVTQVDISGVDADYENTSISTSKKKKG
jgi:hypothetical protein